MSEQLITIEHDGSFQAIMTFDKKSYVLMDYKGKIKLRGQSLKGRNLEPFTRELLRRCIDRLFDDIYIRDIYDEYDTMLEHRIMPAELIASTATLNDTLEGYKNKVAQNPNKNKQAQYELAINSDRKYEKGDQISYYLTEPPLIEKIYKNGKTKTVKANLPAFEKAKHIKFYDYDYDLDHYKDRLLAVTKRLLPVLREEGFMINFPELKLKTADIKKLTNYDEQDEQD